VAREVLRAIDGSAAGREIALDDDFTIGRGEEGMGNLAGDPELSRQHARFRRTEQGQVVVEDLDSTNGTYVGAERLAGPHLLTPGDQIAVGRTLLRFERRRGAGIRALLPAVLGLAVAGGLYAWGKNLTPDYSTSLFGQTAADTLPLKAWLGTALLALALVQVTTALWLYGKLGRARPPRRLGRVHRLTGVAAIVVSLPIAYHCMLAYGFRSFDTRTAVHSTAGVFLYGAILAKVTVVRSKRLPGFALPLAGGTVVTLVAVLWYSAALWYFNDSHVPLLSSAGAASTAPTAPAYPAGAARVTMKDIQFAPRSIRTRVGRTIVWTNRDSLDHNVTATRGASFRSSDFGAGGSYRYKAVAAGRIAYVCTIHPNMTGTIVVTR